MSLESSQANDLGLMMFAKYVRNGSRKCFLFESCLSSSTLL